MSVYLDTSVIVPLFLIDPFASRAKAYFLSNVPEVVVSDLASAEFAAVVAARIRMRQLTDVEARSSLSQFDNWKAAVATGALAVPSDIGDAERFIRRLDLNLRTPDAIHIAIARRLGGELATFDTRMAECARALGAGVAAL